jgi:hypothetical protein
VCDPEGIGQHLFIVEEKANECTIKRDKERQSESQIEDLNMCVGVKDY